MSSHGLWAKKNPFDFITPASSADVQIAAITRARIKWNKNFIFWKSVPPVVIDLHSDFAYKGQAHQVAIKQTEEIGWYSEELFARFEVLELRGEITTQPHK